MIFGSRTVGFGMVVNDLLSARIGTCPNFESRATVRFVKIDHFLQLFNRDSATEKWAEFGLRQVIPPAAALRAALPLVASHRYDNKGVAMGPSGTQVPFVETMIFDLGPGLALTSPECEPHGPGVRDWACGDSSGVHRDGVFGSRT